MWYEHVVCVCGMSREVFHFVNFLLCPTLSYFVLVTFVSGPPKVKKQKTWSFPHILHQPSHSILKELLLLFFAGYCLSSPGKFSTSACL